MKKSRKRILFIATVFVTLINHSCSPVISQDNALIDFEKKEHDFEELTYKKEAVYSFQFRNPGKSPLVIFDVKTSCGCTVPEWTKKLVKPGGAGEIKIKYDADLPGVFRKTIKVYFNGKDSPVKLTIKGKVTYPEDLKGAEDEE